MTTTQQIAKQRVSSPRALQTSPLHFDNEKNQLNRTRSRLLTEHIMVLDLWFGFYFPFVCVIILWQYLIMSLKTKENKILSKDEFKRRHVCYIQPMMMSKPQN